MYRLFIANRNYSSWSLRPWVLMRELAIPFDEMLVPFGQTSGGFKSISPSGRVPCLVDGSVVIWDSLAITEYLAEWHGAVWPGNSVARAWGRCATAEMHSGFAALRTYCSMNCGIRVQAELPLPDRLRGDLDRIDELWREGLTRFGGPWLAGPQFTAVDAFFAPVAFRLQSYSMRLSQFSDTYAARVLALPSLQSWYSLALAETWRDEEHELEARLLGPRLADLRRTQ